MFWTEEETGPLMHGASLCGEKSFSMWVDRFVSNLDRSFMHKQGCVVCVHVRVSFFEGFSGVQFEMYAGELLQETVKISQTDKIFETDKIYVHPMSSLLINHFNSVQV